MGEIESSIDLRESLAFGIRAFLAGELTMFEIEESLRSYFHDRDPVVREVAILLCMSEHELPDDSAHLTKPQWDFLQRLLLVLESNCRVRSNIAWDWSPRQPFAVLGLLLFVWTFFTPGSVEFGWIITLALGLFSMMIQDLEAVLPDEQKRIRPIVSPFASFADLARAQRSSKFRKSRYPRNPSEKCESGPRKRSVSNTIVHALFSSIDVFLWSFYRFAWLIFAPVMLFVQSLPRPRHVNRFVMHR